MLAEADDLAVVVEGDLHVVQLLFRVGAGHQVLDPVLDPLHGPPELPREQRDHDLLGEEVALLTEAAAYVGRDHLDFVFRHARERGDHRAEEVGHLRRRPER